MKSCPRSASFSYLPISECRWHGFLSAVHEPSPEDTRTAAPVRLHLSPGQKGTRQLLAEYGDRLICVRYRYDLRRKKRYKTAEIVVAERDWEPRRRFGADEIVALRVAFSDVEIRARVKQAGGKWNPEQTVWQLRYDRAAALRLEDRIVSEPASYSGRSP